MSEQTELIYQLSGQRILGSRIFEPVRESLQDIIGHTNPRGKRVLSVASYGGFPLAFLAEGAKEVLAFDVDPGKIGWNHFLRASVLALSYGENLAFFQHQPGAPKPQQIGDRIESILPVEHAQEALNRMLIFKLCYPHLADRVTDLYPHLRDEDTFDQVRTATANGAWQIRDCELRTLLRGMERLESDRRFDVMYVSSIRNWVLDLVYRGDIRKFEEEYDAELGKLVTGLLSKGGIFYEAMIKSHDFPAVRIPAKFYPKLEMYEYPSCDSESDTVVTLGVQHS